jgi:hypothetical protein
MIGLKKSQNQKISKSAINAWLLVIAKLYYVFLPFINDHVKVTTFKGSKIYLIGGLIVLFTDLLLEQCRSITGMFFKKTVEISVIFKIQATCNFFYRVLAPE